MNKEDIQRRFDTLMGILMDNEFSKTWLNDFSVGVLTHIAKLEEEIKIQQEIMDQQVSLIMEMREEK